MKKTIFLLSILALAPFSLLTARDAGHGGGGRVGGGVHGADHHDGRYGPGNVNDGMYFDSGYDPAYWDDTLNYQPNPESQPGMSDDSTELYDSYLKDNPPQTPLPYIWIRLKFSPLVAIADFELSSKFGNRPLGTRYSLSLNDFRYFLIG